MIRATRGVAWSVTLSKDFNFPESPSAWTPFSVQFSTSDVTSAVNVDPSEWIDLLAVSSVSSFEMSAVLVGAPALGYGIYYGHPYVVGPSGATKYLALGGRELVPAGCSAYSGVGSWRGPAGVSTTFVVRIDAILTNPSIETGLR